MDLTWESPILLSYRSRHSVEARETSAHKGDVFQPNRFLRHGSDLPPSAPDFATAIGVPSARHRRPPASPQHLAKRPEMQMRLGR